MIRKYHKEDLEKVIEIWYKSSTIAHPFLENDFVGLVKKAMREFYIPRSHSWVYEKEKAVVGFISMNDNEIGGLFVLPQYLGQGIGTQMVNQIVKVYKQIEVEVFEENRIGRAFYDKYGFEFINRYYHEASKEFVLRLCYPHLPDS